MLQRKSVEKLKEQIAMPNWETQLLPLFLFKGSKPYSIRANLNVAYGMFLEEVESGSDAAALFDPDTIHLCGKHCKRLDFGAMRSIFSRLHLRPEVARSISRPFHEYVEHMTHLNWLPLTPVPRGTYDFRPGVTAWWREGLERPRKHRVWRAPTEPTQYPFMPKADVHALTSEQKLLLDVHQKLPRSIPSDIRGDLCQDLIVAILSGETTVENIPDVIGKYSKAARKFLPDRWKHVSLDATVAGTSDLRVGDTLTRTRHLHDFECGHDE